MQSLFDKNVRDGIRARLLKLTPETKPQWGKSNAPQILAHLNDSMVMTFGEKDFVAQKGFLNSAIGRWMVIDAPMPWPKGAPTMPELWVSQPGNFEQDKTRLVEYLDRFAKGREQKWGVSPKTGHLTPEQWARLTYRHIDHHLRQLGL